MGRDAVAVSLRQNLLLNATDRHGSRVTEEALKHCSSQDVDELAEELLASIGTVRRLTQSDFGCHVLRALSAADTQACQKMSSYVFQLEGDLETSKGGKRLLEEVRSHFSEL